MADVTGVTDQTASTSGADALSGLKETINNLNATTTVADGGTGATTLTANGVLVGNGTGAIQATAVGTSGHVLTSNGAGSDPTFQEAPVTASNTVTFTNKTFDANATGNSLSNVDVADLANGTDGELITWDAAGAPTTVAVGTAGHVLTSNGAGAAPTFQAVAGTIAFGGDGSDGALSISTGTTNIDLAGARIKVLNYTSISITGNAAITFSNPHDDGTTIIWRSQGDVTLTSSAVRGIDLRLIGGKGGVGVINGNGGNGKGKSWQTKTLEADGNQYFGDGGNNSGTDALKPGGGGASSVRDGAPQISPTVTNGTAPFSSLIDSVDYFIWGVGREIALHGAGGGAGRSDSTTTAAPDGGRGAGALLIECAGALDFGASFTIDATGEAGVNGSDSGAGVNYPSGGGGGGTVLIVYNTLTTNAGTITVTGGLGGDCPVGVCSPNDAANGGAGLSLVLANKFIG